MEYNVGVLLLGMAIVLLSFYCRKRKKIQVYSSNKAHRDLQDIKKKKDYIKIKVYRNDKKQIEISCYNMKDDKVAQLLAGYILKGDYRQGQQDFIVHLEQIFVGSMFRRRGIGKLMFNYLLKEMLAIEKEESVRFRYIYGEVGVGGTDDPKKSIPFYKKMDGISYGDKRIRYEFQNKKNGQEYDKFYYFISSTGDSYQDR